MRRMFSRGFVLMLVIVFAIAFAAIFIISSINNRNALIDTKVQDLVPHANIIAQLTSNYLSNKITNSVFRQLCEQVSCSAGTNVYVSDPSLNQLCYFGSEKWNNLPGKLLKSDRKKALEVVFSGQSYDSVDISVDGVAIIIVGSPVFDIDKSTVIAGVFVMTTKAEVLDPIIQSNTTLIVALFLVLSFSVAVAYFSIKALNKPYKKLLAATKQLAAAKKDSDFDIYIDEDGLGEYAVFAQALNTLSAHIIEALKNIRMEKRQVNQVISGLTDGIAAININDEITHFNGALMRIFESKGISTQIDLIPYKDIWDAFHAVLDTDEARMFTYVLPNGKSILVSISNVYDDDNRCTGAVGLFKDSTEMEKVECMRREYIANISHELRTPLTTLRGLLEPLSDNMIHDENTKHRYYDIMIQEVCRLSRLITDMMTLSKLQSDSVRFDIAEVAISEMLNMMLIGIITNADSKHIDVETDIDDNLYALVDEDRLAQLVIILTDNAIKYTPDGGKIVIFAKYLSNLLGILMSDNVAISNPTFNASKCKDKIVLGVKDTGCGIGKDDLARIFERFYTVDRSRTAGSTGLGLAIAYQVTRLLDETIIVHSEEGCGSTFMLTLKGVKSHE